MADFEQLQVTKIELGNHVWVPKAAYEYKYIRGRHLIYNRLYYFCIRLDGVVCKVLASIRKIRIRIPVEAFSFNKNFESLSTH